MPETTREELIASARELDAEGYDSEASYTGPGRTEGTDRELAVALDSLHAHGADDEETGTVEAPTGHVSRTARWLLTTNSQGFLSVEEFPTEHDAQQAFAAIEREYGVWGGEPDKCRWWYLCPNDATGTEPHPVLGDVPICDRCRRRVRALEGHGGDDA